MSEREEETIPKPVRLASGEAHVDAKLIFNVRLKCLAS